MRPSLPWTAAAALALFLLPTLANAGAEIGKKAPDFDLPDARGQIHKLSDYRNRVVVLEWTNQDCPFVQRHYREGTMKGLVAIYKDSNVVWLAINSTHYNTPEDTQQWSAAQELPYPTLLDTDGAVGHLYGAKTTPHMYVIDPEGNLVYAGAIDDDPEGKKPISERLNYVDSALQAILHGNTPIVSETKSYGCSIKYAR